MILSLLFSEPALGWIIDSICSAILSPTCHLPAPMDRGCRSQLDESEKVETDDGRGECKS